MTRRSESLDLWPDDSAVDLGLRLNRRGRLNPLAPASRDDDPIGVRCDRVEQLDLHAHDRVEARLVGRGRETDGAVEALVVGQCDAGQAQLDGALNEILDARRAVEEREVRVAMKFGKGAGHGHRSILERLFYLARP
jgi:hypothetical protein